jgi:cyclase
LLRPRLIPALLLNGRRLVKTRQFRNPKYVGDPINAVRILNEKRVDELFLFDIAASAGHPNPDLKFLEEVVSEASMPVCFGGGIKDIETADNLFSIGVEKISLRSAPIANTGLLQDLAERFGSQAIVFSLDLKKDWLGKWQTHANGSNFRPTRDWKSLISQAISSGAGEVLFTNVDREGTRSGVDLEIVMEVASITTVPLVVQGGVGSMADVQGALQAGADGVAAGAFFVFHGPHDAVLITYPLPEEMRLLSAPTALAVGKADGKK